MPHPLDFKIYVFVKKDSPTVFRISATREGDLRRSEWMDKPDYEQVISRLPGEKKQAMLDITDSSYPALQWFSEPEVNHMRLRKGL